MVRIAFRPLWTVMVQHGFFGGVSDALSFTVPPATERVLARAHAVLRVLDGTLHVLVAVYKSNALLSNFNGLRLLIGLKPREASFALFEAQAIVARRARGPTGLELHRNGDMLIGNLPQPRAERHDAQFVVHLSLS